MQRKGSRRRFIKGIGAVALVGSLAGCGGDDEDTETRVGNSNGNGTTEGGTQTGDETQTAGGTQTGDETRTGDGTQTRSETRTGDGTQTRGETRTAGGTQTETETGTPTPIPGPEEYLSNAYNYDGEFVDETGSDSVTVGVGEGGNFFEPPAIRISTGTTVVWEWIGGFHNVVAEDGTFRSGDPVTEQGKTYEYTFDETGEWAYYCNPHKGRGMKGYIIVE